MTGYQRHKSRWEHCIRCPLCETRQNVVLCKGKLPCDVLFLGEAPGASEDALGVPFIGPAGKLMDQIIRDAKELSGDWSHALTNLIACIPLDENLGKTGEPDPDHILKCLPRLQELYGLAKPRLVINVGEHAAKWLDRVIPHRDVPSANIVHPGAIIRVDIAMQSLPIKRSIIAISDAVTKYLKKDS